MNTCPRDKFNDFITNSSIHHRDYKEYDTKFNKPMKRLLLILKGMVYLLLAFIFFALGIVYERFNGFENFIKSQSKIEYNTKEYKYYRNYKYKV